jgi:hypothetical protein
VLREPASAPFFSALKPRKTSNFGDRLRNFSNDPERKRNRAITKKFGNKFFGGGGFDET